MRGHISARFQKVMRTPEGKLAYKHYLETGDATRLNDVAKNITEEKCPLNLEPGWMKRQNEIVASEASLWPGWRRKECGLPEEVQAKELPYLEGHILSIARKIAVIKDTTVWSVLRELGEQSYLKTLETDNSHAVPENP